MKVFRTCLILAFSLVMLLMLGACTGGSGGGSMTDAPTETPNSETDAPTEPVTEPGDTAEPVTEVPTEAPTEPVTEDPNQIPTVSADVIGTANVAPLGYVMGSSTLQDSTHSNMFLTDGTTQYAFSSQDFTTPDAEAHLFIDLAGSFTLRQVVLYPSDKDTDFFPAAFDIEVSDDGVTYTTVKSCDGVAGVDGSGYAIDMGGVRATFVRLTVREMNGSGSTYRYALGEMEVIADIDRTTNLILNQNDIWLYIDTSETLRYVSRRVANVADETPLRFMTADESIVTVDHESGQITPVGYGDTVVYAFDGENLTACKVRVIDERETTVRISTFYHSSFGYPEVIPQCLDYMVGCGIEFLEETRAYDAVGNQVCDYMMYLCAKRGIFYSVCDPLNSKELSLARETKLTELIQKYEHRAGFGGIYLVDEPHEESNDYARVAAFIRNYNYHITPHLNLLPIGGFPSWEEYVSEYCAITGGVHRMEYLSYDNYAFLYGGGFNTGVYNSLNRIRIHGLKYNASTGYYMQAMEILGAYRISSPTELLYNATLGVAYGMKNFKWFVYLTPIGSGESFTTGLIAADFTPSVMYDGVTAANARIKELGAILGASDAVEVYHHSANNGNERVPSTFPITQTSSNDAIYTLYCPINGQGQQYVVISNKNFSESGDREFALRLADDLDSLEVLDGGVFQEVMLNGKDFAILIPAGDCAVFRLPEGYDGRQPTVSAGDNLALGGTAFVSSSTYTFWTASETASFHLNDGNTASGGWISTSRDAAPYILMDLKEATTVSRVVLYPYVGEKTSRFPAAFSIMVSADGENWTEAYTTSEAVTDGTGAWECVFDPTNARYVYVKIETPKKVYALGEIEIYAD